MERGPDRPGHVHRDRCFTAVQAVGRKSPHPSPGVQPARSALASLRMNTSKKRCKMRCSKPPFCLARGRKRIWLRKKKPVLQEFAAEWRIRDSNPGRVQQWQEAACRNGGFPFTLICCPFGYCDLAPTWLSVNGTVPRRLYR